MRRFLILLSLLVLSSLPLSEADAAVYYVDSLNGNDSNDGRSPISALRTLHALGSKPLLSGDDALLRSGSVFENQSLYIGWGGTHANWAKLDCYRVNAGNVAADCVSTDPKPEINGTFQPSCASSGQCAYENTAAVPSSIWGSLIMVEADYVSVRNISVKDSAGYPVIFLSRATRPRHHFVLEDVSISHSFQGIVLIGGSYQHGVVRRVDASMFGLCELYRYSPCLGAGWPSGITVHDSPQAMVLIENNVVHDGYGEGFNCLRSSHVVFRGNRVGNVHSDGYYLDQCSNSVIENNIAWGDLDNRWGSGGAFAGVNVATEDYPGAGGYSAVDNVIRNNLITGYGACLSSSQWPEAIARGLKIGFNFYGNSCIGSRIRNVSLYNSTNPTTILVKNNIFYSPFATDGSCLAPGSASITFENNLWDSHSRSSRCYGANDLVDDPKLVTPMSEFGRFSWSNQPQPRHFGLQASSPALTRGSIFPSENKLNSADFASVIGLLSSDRCVISNSPLAHDFYCVERQAPPSLGAIDRSKYPPRPPLILSLER